MRLCFYSDYLATSRGGGERHVLSVALAAAHSHQVTLAFPDTNSETIPEIKAQLADFMGVSLDSLVCLPSPGKTSSSRERWQWFNAFDGVFWVCDGSIPLPVAKRRYLHIQIPFTHPLRSLASKAKWHFWQSHANTNSLFTKSVIEKSWHTTIPSVLWPLVENYFSEVAHKHKKNTIVSVGRFFTHLHAKRQDILVNIFKTLRQSNSRFSSYELILIGSVEDKEYLKNVQKAAAGLPVTFIHQASRKDLKQYLADAKYYWHAAGYGVNEELHPEAVEHFGISVAESMAAGCIPLVVGLGGMREVLGKKLFQTCAWSTVEECIAKASTIESQPTLQAHICTAAQKHVQLFTKSQFEKRVSRYFSDEYYQHPTSLYESN